MKVFIKIAVFSLIVVGFYTFFAVGYIPEITPEEPPEEKAIDVSNMGPEEFVAFGEEVYLGKGACTLCHNPMGRAPVLDDIALKAAGRLKDPGYRGRAVDIEGYLYESMVEPSVYVVPGFGVAGTDDTVSPMPDVRGSTIGLNEVEIKAVIAYLQSIAGVEVTVAPPSEDIAQ